MSLEVKKSPEIDEISLRMASAWVFFKILNSCVFSAEKKLWHVSDHPRGKLHRKFQKNDDF